MSSIPASPPADPHPVLDGSPAPIDVPTRLAAATQVLLYACGATFVATIGVEAFGLAAVDSFLGGNAAAFASLTTYDQLSMAVNIVATVVLVATGVLWAMWQYKTAKQFPGRTRRSAGWHAGSWFIPIISLVYPYQNISDLWGAVGRPRPRWLIVWWLAWIVGNIVSGISGRIYLAVNTLEGFRAAMAVTILAEIILLIAVPLAVLVVRGITGGTTERAVGDG